MAEVLFVLHHGREQAVALACDAIEWLAKAGHKGVILESDALPTGLNEWSVESLDAINPDLAVTLGGDGTMLRALDLVCKEGIPVLGVNVGHLGYLTEVEPDQLLPSLERFLTGDFHIQERMMLDVSVTAAARNDPTGTTLSLSHRIAANDVVVEKVQSGQTVRLESIIEGRSFLSYAVDGMIVATPTGSTAYNFSARGPILSPGISAILMTPVSPHMLFDRSIVLDGHEGLELRVIGRESASVAIDGRHVATIGPGGAVVCKRADNPARLVKFAGRNFHEILKIKFGLTDR